MAEAGNLSKNPKRGYAALKDNGLKLKTPRVKSFYYSRTFKHSITNSTDMQRIWAPGTGSDETLHGTYTDGFYVLPYTNKRSAMTPDNLAEIYRNFCAAKVTEYGCRIKSCAVKDTLVTKNANSLKVEDIKTEAGQFVVLHDQGNFFRQRRRMINFNTDLPDNTGLLTPYDGVNRPPTALDPSDPGDMVDTDPDVDLKRRLSRVCWALPQEENGYLGRDTSTGVPALGYPENPPWILDSYCKTYSSVVGMGTSFQTNMPFVPMGPIDTPETLFATKTAQNNNMPWLGDAKITEWLDNKFPTHLSGEWGSYFAIPDQEKQIYGAQPPDFYLRLNRELHSESQVDRWAEIEVEYYVKGAGILPPQRSYDMGFPTYTWIAAGAKRVPWNKVFVGRYCPLTYHHLAEYERLYGQNRPEYHTQDDQEETAGLGPLIIFEHPTEEPPTKRQAVDPPTTTPAAEPPATTNSTE